MTRHYFKIREDGEEEDLLLEKNDELSAPAISWNGTNCTYITSLPARVGTGRYIPCGTGYSIVQ